MARRLKTEEPANDAPKQHPDRMPAGMLAAQGDEPACERCGARLTVSFVGTTYPCGHDPKSQGSYGKVWSRENQTTPQPAGVSPAAPVQGAVNSNLGLSLPTPKIPGVESWPSSVGVIRGNPNTSSLSLVGQQVTVVWGKELFTPKQFHTYEVGPFTASVTVGAGETFELAALRAMTDLRRFAEAERARKKASYEASLKG